MPPLQPFLRRPIDSLVVPCWAIATILADGWASWPLETGGLLLGHREDNHRLGGAVMRVIGPGPGAQHDRYGFKPDATWQAEQVAATWAEDNTLEYLGDWHTHPAGTTRFSRLDQAAARTIAEASLARQSNPIMVVAALHANLSSEIRAGVLVNGRLRSLTVSVDNNP